jgi:hypothetical protein
VRSTVVAAGISLALLVGSAGVRRDSLSNYSDARELFRGNSNFGLLQVLENKTGDRCFYLNDFLSQNTYDPHTKQSLSLFTFMLHGLARAYAPQINDALCIGLGVGIVPMRLAREGVKVDVVEINPATGEQLGARWINANPAQYPPGNGNLFGIAMKPDGSGFYYVSDDVNTLQEAVR